MLENSQDKRHSLVDGWASTPGTFCGAWPLSFSISTKSPIGSTSKSNDDDGSGGA